MAFEKVGHALFPQALSAEALSAARQHFDALQVGAGRRLHNACAFGQLLGADGDIGRVAKALLGQDARPVRLVLFNKTGEHNWAVGWHQDRVIAVQRRADVAGFDHWTVKDGQLHVKPPFDLLSQMVTLRVHLDPVDGENAPLKVVDGSHRLGALTKAEVAVHAARSSVTTCHADAGDIWAYRTPILHSSEVSRSLAPRRTIQIDYAASQPGGGLQWAFPDS
ncbi:phytanoyl-CoA dioxygenase family protein [Sphingomicrobium flavum]|uniref:phytanoyl-CoA dioxygenase family protein n=1 Tax=Sphingomicrobium flavum TaxID=1229164 RepID=UPI0021ADEC74|nr:phytanoyl-CoA dioxygenase family protein [Sphingomicrobium flavum]